MLPDEDGKGACMKDNIIINDTEKALPEAPLRILLV